MHTDSETRHAAGNSSDIPEHGRLVVDVGGQTVGIFRVKGRLYAYENTCPHQGGPVCQGLIIPAVRELVNADRVSTGYAFDENEMRIVCPWHGYEFSIQRGSHPAKAEIRLKAVAVSEENGVVYVTI